MKLPTVALTLAWASMTLAGWCADAPQGKPAIVREADYSGPIRLACVGDSITYGYGLKDRERDCYPSQLSRLLGEKWQVENFGVNGACVLSKGRRPYTQQLAFEKAVAFRPDVVVLKLGTNDTRREDWEQFHADFAADFADLIGRFSRLDPKPRIYVCLPVPIFRDRGKDYDLNVVLREQIVPQIQRVARQAEVPVIDLYAELQAHEKLLPDGVHPTAAGASRVAAAVYAALTGRQANSAER